MKQALVLVYEQEGHLAARLEEASKSQRFTLKTVRRPSDCLDSLRRTGASVLLMKLGRDVEQELSLLEQVSWLFPDTATVVTGDVDNPVLASLCWDLGAACVHFPPLLRDFLPEIVTSLLKSNEH